MPAVADCETSVIMHTGNGALERAVVAFFSDHPDQRQTLRLLTAKEFMNVDPQAGCASAGACGQLICMHVRSLSPVESQPDGDDDPELQRRWSEKRNAKNGTSSTRRSSGTMGVKAEEMAGGLSTTS